MLLILSMDSVLRGVSNFINGYMGEALVKGVANFINRFFAKRVSKFVNGYIGEGKIVKKTIIQWWKSENKKAVKYEAK